MDFKIDTVTDEGNDVLQVTATTSDGRAVAAFGWVSATTNHYDAAAYSDVDGDLVRDPAASPRAMTPAEVGEYARRLILEQNPELAATPAAVEATPITFEAP